MKKEERTELIEKYGNLKELAVPKINPELEMHLPKSTKTRDNYMHLRQNLASSALSSLGLAATKLIENKENVDRKGLFNIVLDAGTLIADLIHCQTKSRRSFMISTMPKDKREILQATKPDQFLFGEKLSEKFKESKNWENLFLTKNTSKKPSQQRPALNPIGLQGNRPAPYHAGYNQDQWNYPSRRKPKPPTQQRPHNHQAEQTPYPPRKQKPQQK